MFSARNASELAARIRSLLGSDNPAELHDIASTLGVSAIDLREILVYNTPYPAVQVLAAVVAYYGVDAGWLLTGEYSPTTHRANEEAGQPAKVQLDKLLRDEAAAIGFDDRGPAKSHLAQLLSETPAADEHDPGPSSP